MIDMNGSLLVVFADSSVPVRLAAKYRPGVPLLVLTRSVKASSVCSLIHGALAVVVARDVPAPSKEGLVQLVRVMSQ